MSTTSRITTAEELFAAGDIGRCELVRGELIMMSPAGGEHGRIIGRLTTLLGAFVLERELGAIYGAETGFIIARDPDTVRGPDLAFITEDRVAEARTVKFIPVPPDLAVEVLSPDDRRKDVAEKTACWLAAGVRVEWVVDPRTRTVTVHRPDAEPVVLHEDDTLDGGDVVPGFTLPVKTIFG